MGKTEPATPIVLCEGSDGYSSKGGVSVIMAAARRRRRGRGGMFARGSNQYQKRAKPAEPYEFDPVACESHNNRVREARALNAAITRPRAFRELLRNLYPASAVVADTRLPEDVAKPLPRVAAAVARQSDMSVPHNAATMGGRAVDEFRDALTQLGADPSKMEVRRLTGLHRHESRTSADGHGVDGDVHRRYIDHHPDFSHEVLVVRGSAGEPDVVIDPTAASLAPVTDPSLPVTDQPGFEDSPYGDYPLIQSWDDYMNNARFHWDKGERVR